MSYGVFNWWWGEKDAYDGSWLINHVNEIVADVRPDRNNDSYSLLMQHRTETKPYYFNLGWLDFSFLPLSKNFAAQAYYDVDTVSGPRHIADWMEQNIRLPLDVEGNYGTISPDTITAFIKTLKTHRPFYEENILKGEPFVWIPKIPSAAAENWYAPDGVDWSEIDRLMVDIGEGYICINPEANRIITHYLSDNYTEAFEEVADTADWDYPQWYLEGSPPLPPAR